MGLIPDQRAVQQFGAECLDPAFHARVHAGHPDTGQHRSDSRGAEDFVDQRGVFGVAITNEELDLREVSGVLEVHEQVADGLGDPGMGGVRGRADYPYTATGVVDDGENVLALAGQRDRLDEVHRQDRLRLRAQEVRPVTVVRRGAGSTPAVLRISHTVEAATATPRSASSPWIRRYPHDGFSAASRRTSRRIEATVRGRPGARFTLARAWRPFVKSRCHLSTVSGLTNSRKRRNAARVKGSRKAASNALSSGRSRGR